VEAKKEILKALKCKESLGLSNQPWKSWNILADIETAAGDGKAGEVAKAKARDSFLAYRRVGEEVHRGPSKLVCDVGKFLRQGKNREVHTFLQVFVTHEEPKIRSLVRVMKAIVNGDRSKSVITQPDLHYESQVELLLLFEALAN
jgi:hypothetical protein